MATGARSQAGDVPPLSDKEIENLRRLLRGFTANEWRALKKFAAALAAGQGAPPGGNGNGHAAPAQQDELPDHFLSSQPWADREIARDPTRWAGDPMKGYRYSEAPSEWLEIQASALEYKAAKGRESPTPRLQTKGKNAGKPWHEADAFEARICRAWARRNRGKKLPPPRSEMNGAGAHESAADTGDANEDFVP